MDAFRGKFYFAKKKGQMRRYWTPPAMEKVAIEFVKQLPETNVTPPRSIESVTGEKQALHAQLAAQQEQYEKLEASRGELEARVKQLRREMIERKKEWKEKIEGVSGELALLKSTTTSAVAKAITTIHESTAQDAILKQQLLAAQQTNEAHSKAMRELNTQFVELMNTISAHGK